MRNEFIAVRKGGLGGRRKKELIEGKVGGIGGKGEGKMGERAKRTL